LSQQRRRLAPPLSSGTTPLLKSPNTAAACSLRGAGNRGKLVGRGGVYGQLAASLELNGNSASRVDAASRAVNVFQPHENLGKPIRKTPDGRSYASPNKRFCHRNRFSDYNAADQIAESSVECIHPQQMEISKGDSYARADRRRRRQV
jgi:hypothetical protein